MCWVDDARHGSAFGATDSDDGHGQDWGIVIDVADVGFDTPGATPPGLPGGKGELYVNGEKVDEVDLPDMHISTFSLSETFDVGIDAGTPVSNKYRITNHYPYTGELDKVVVTLTD